MPLCYTLILSPAPYASAAATNAANSTCIIGNAHFMLSGVHHVYSEIESNVMCSHVKMSDAPEKTDAVALMWFCSLNAKKKHGKKKLYSIYEVVRTNR